MIKDYSRPESLPKALELLQQPNTLALGGGTMLSRPGPTAISVVDLQSLGLDKISKKGNNLEVGGTVNLQQLIENKHIPNALKVALKLDAPLNIRNAATIAGTLVAADGRSSATSALLALDAKMTILDPGAKTVSLGEFLPLRPENLPGILITTITIPLKPKLAFEFVSRAPADKPILCAALGVWPSGRARLALGGYGKMPLLAMDGTVTDELETAARNAFHEAGDEWSSAEYRMDVAATLTKRCVEAT